MHAGQALLLGSFLPIRPGIGTDNSASGAYHAGAEPWYMDIIRASALSTAAGKVGLWRTDGCSTAIMASSGVQWRAAADEDGHLLLRRGTMM
jgi:hypothetical protein